MLGGHLVRFFAGRGAAVRAGVRRASDYHPPMPGAVPGGVPGAGVVPFDCDLPDRLDRTALDGADACIHCAYATRSRSPAQAKRTNEDGTRAVYEACRQADMARFVFVSSLSAHDGARSYYGRSKFALEQMMDPKRDLIVRPGVLLALRSGLFARIVDVIRRRSIIPLIGAGRQRLQVLHVDDCCRAMGAAVDKALTGRIVLAHPTPITMRQLIDEVARRLDRRLHYLPLPAAPTLAALKTAQWLRLPMPVTSDNLLGLLSMRPQDPTDDLKRLGVDVLAVQESLDLLLA